MSDGLPPPPSLQHRVRDLVEADGLPKASLTLGLSREAVARFVAGLGVRQGTIVQIQMFFDKEKARAAARRKAG